ncbi:MAG: PaaI family thioesterase [Alphaproteobacteria bacterium]|nr:PaaI family thioesterase [Alphaproteobacteria bacterium]
MPSHELVTEGPWAGWTHWRGHFPNRFTELLGSHYYRRGPDGRMEAGMDTAEKHLNGLGHLHGGFLMAFIDQVMFAIARPSLSPSVGAVTLSCDTHFLGSGVGGMPIYGTGEVLRETGRMIFIRGTLSQNDDLVCAFTGTLRKVPRQLPPSV